MWSKIIWSQKNKKINFGFFQRNFLIFCQIQPLSLFHKLIISFYTLKYPINTQYSKMRIYTCVYKINFFSTMIFECLREITIRSTSIITYCCFSKKLLSNWHNVVFLRSLLHKHKNLLQPWVLKHTKNTSTIHSDAAIKYF